MTTISPTFHVQLFPTTFPPFSNDPEAEKRSFHRQRSTHRLEAARGTTPLFLDLDSKTDITTNSPTSPRSRAVRRKGQLFNSPTSPISSSTTDSIESDYMFVNAQVQSDFQLHSPSSSCIMSPPGNPVTNGNRHRGISVKAKAGKKAGIRSKTTKTASEGPQPLAQPFLLQLRSLPVHRTANINPSNRPVTNNSKSLSPISSSFNMHSTTTTTTTTSSRRHVPRALTAHEKIRKLEKLSRTLGENIPPELVFHSSTNTTTPTTTPLQRTTSVSTSGSRWKVSRKPSLQATPTSKTSTPLSRVPDRAAAAAPTTTPQSGSTREPEIRMKHQQHKTRPRSMTTVPSPTMATPSSTRGASLDRPTSPPFQEIIVTVGPETTRDARSPEWGRRGKDWSGEWNVKNMDYVAKALRDLKAR